MSDGYMIDDNDGGQSLKKNDELVPLEGLELDKKRKDSEDSGELIPLDVPLKEKKSSSSTYKKVKGKRSTIAAVLMLLIAVVAFSTFIFVKMNVAASKNNDLLAQNLKINEDLQNTKKLLEEQQKINQEQAKSLEELKNKGIITQEENETRLKELQKQNETLAKSNKKLANEIKKKDNEIAAATAAKEDKDKKEKQELEKKKERERELAVEKFKPGNPVTLGSYPYDESGNKKAIVGRNNAVEDVRQDLATPKIPEKPRAVNPDPGNNVTETRHDEYQKLSVSAKVINGTIKIPSIGILFEPEASTLYIAAMNILDAFADLYRRTDGKTRILLEGFSSNARNETENNPLIASERINSVEKYLVKIGIPQEMIIKIDYSNTRIGERLFARDKTCLGNACNMRVNISIQNDQGAK